MKRVTFSLALLLPLLAIFAFSWKAETNYKGLSSNEAETTFLFTNQSSELNANLSDFFSTEFDQIDRVDTHWEAELDYYYAVYGKKDGLPVVQKVLISKEMAYTHSFPTVQEMGLESASAIIKCYWNIIVEDGSISIDCTVDPAQVVCGVSPSGGLCVRIRQIEPIDP